MTRMINTKGDVITDSISDISIDLMNEQSQGEIDSHNQEIRDCYNDLGHVTGFYDGYYELEAKMNGTFVEPADYSSGYNTALDSCGNLLPLPEQIEIPIPIFKSPVLLALEVMFTPTELADGTIKDTIDVRAQDYQNSYADGHDAGMSRSFDDRLEERFTPDFSDPVVIYPASYDSPTAAPAYGVPDSGSFDSGSSWSSGGGDDGGSYSSGGDSSGGGGSSGGGSSSSD